MHVSQLATMEVDALTTAQTRRSRFGRSQPACRGEGDPFSGQEEDAPEGSGAEGKHTCVLDNAWP